MPSKDHDADTDDRRREKRTKSKSERSKSEKEPRAHKSSRSSRIRDSDLDSTTHSHSSRRHRTRDEPVDTQVSMTELSKTSLGSTERISRPYASFNKSHSKEYIVSREDVSAVHRVDPLTPEPTDIGGDDKEPSKSADRSPSRKASTSKKNARPPSPPETDIASEKKRSGTPDVSKTDPEERPRSRTSLPSRSGSRKDDKSRVSSKSKVSSQATYIKSPTFKSSSHNSTLHPEDRRSSGPSRSSSKRSTSSKSTKRPDLVDGDSSQESVQESSPKTPTQTPQFPPPTFTEEKLFPPRSVDIQGTDAHSPTRLNAGTPATDFGPPPPPPPPPAPLEIHEAPRVDYLVQNGGLPYPVPKTFLSVLPRQNGTRPSNPPLAGAQTLFAPFFNLLEQYQTVLNKSGSIAVATGNRSVARRLLDRLENVFSRDLPPYGCTCIMCEKSHEIHRGLGWGEVLEWVSGRIELPQWPPFDLATLGAKAAECTADLPARPASPVKLDPDIAEEFREHYLRQTKKVRSAVDKWLNNCAEAPAPPPQDVDDETLTFAILTSLDQEDRPYFNALLSGAKELPPAIRAPTPMRKPRTDLMIKAGQSLQRLYRLQQAPRDAETCMYLIRNSHTHDLLVTINDINNSEWEILTSGRFDGFLWSGADGDDTGTPHIESRGATPASGYFPHARGTPGPGSRTTTPFSPYSRGATPASFVSLASSNQPNRQAVSNDEEMEIAALAELEREIFQGMEVLEDAFETLHQRAETVRTALRQRSTGLMLSLQNRRRIDVLPNPGSGNSQKSGYFQPPWIAVPSEGDVGSDSEWGADDIELMPDDSASNISSSRHRRPKRRTERRTPAPIEEDEEEA
jgi:hypothetical protein